MRVVSVAVAVPATVTTAGGESCGSAMERDGHHAAFAKHLPGSLCRVHHTAEPPARVSAKLESEKGGRGALESQAGERVGLYASNSQR